MTGAKNTKSTPNETLHLFRLTRARDNGVHWKHCRAVDPITADLCKRIYEILDRRAVYIVAPEEPELTPEAAKKALYPKIF